MTLSKDLLLQRKGPKLRTVQHLHPLLRHKTASKVKEALTVLHWIETETSFSTSRDRPPCATYNNQAIPKESHLQLTWKVWPSIWELHKRHLLWISKSLFQQSTPLRAPPWIFQVGRMAHHCPDAWPKKTDLQQPEQVSNESRKQSQQLLRNNLTIMTLKNQESMPLQMITIMTMIVMQQHKIVIAGRNKLNARKTKVSLGWTGWCVASAAAPTLTRKGKAPWS